ncbi:MAG: glutamine--tRNA ligase/YqeY domain fusion protein [Bdellovibrionales bacterium]|jgi:glutaminyl-tRNA synthetase|nr:glutamine--tRNA ligase/YqeY domain fusion protein [Bdellovibrionales bacterium]MBT3526676.1 glutamine--tRNA ligase/YqeY domain fusion protein [Bdellovibrionales bacterium]MBT7669953.1 glutamine--tRNA ligase/YqeY domain fusion protein [Bdellovibrionales bacterium]MBT7765896.1 glutamine--tRNA ligase/YqeY domain fusion protein [Bdellovibrionales bacterium]
MSQQVDSSTQVGSNFIKQIAVDDLESGRKEYLVTRFPPEPNGHLHIGHAKAICLDFGLAEEFNGSRCHLRFDDSNPEGESQLFVDSIMEDIKWLGFDWGDHLYFASDYFEQLYDYAVTLIKDGKAYVCHQTPEEIRANRGSLTTPGQKSPFRSRTVEESLDLFSRMRGGEFADGHCCLRAKIDMAAPNINLRDPIIYRIKRATHYRTEDKWGIYPMYDFTHAISDAIEDISHSLCTLEFEDHRPLYNWFVQQLPMKGNPRQIEFARLNLDYTVTSKRKLRQLVDQGLVDGWDDPRMPTICGMRRRGYPPAAIRNFCSSIGVTKKDTSIDVAKLESAVREELNQIAPRRMAVLNPLKVTIENYPEGQIEEFQAKNHPLNEELGTHTVPFGRVIYVEREDFLEDAPKKFFRLTVGREVRLRYAYYITCNKVIKDQNGEVVELLCSYDPESKGGGSADNRKVKGTIHWVAQEQSIQGEARLYDRLFSVPHPENDSSGKDYLEFVNQDSLKVVTNVMLGPSFKQSRLGELFQFERNGYFRVEQLGPKLIFGRTITLRDSWAKVASKKG